MCGMGARSCVITGDYASALLLRISMSVHAFLSFVEEDLRLVNLFRGQAKNENLDLEFDDYSVKTPINSDRAPYVKQEIEKKIRRSSVILCLIGSSTYKSQWVKWELKTGAELEKCLIGILLDSQTPNIIPKSLSNNNARIVAWDINDIVNAIRKC